MPHNPPSSGRVTRKTLLRRASPQANKLWSHLTKHTLGFRFVRYYTHGPYTVAFCCVEKKLIIDIDGWKRRDNKEHDKARAEYFSDFGYTVLRFWNNDIDENLENVVKKIHDSLH